MVKVLILEDDFGLVEIYKAALKKEGLDVKIADNGRVGLEIAVKERPNLIILDLVMPIMDGYEFLKKIKQNKNLKDIPVIVASCLGAQDEIDKAIELGAVDFLSKHMFTPREIIEKVRKYIK